jgi:fumarylacetoacetase
MPASSMIDETHDPARRSWVPGADGHADFPIQNLPFGIFAPPGGAPRGGVAIGDAILDIAGLGATGLLTGEAAQAAEAASGTTLNPLLGMGAGPRRALRRRLSALLSADGGAEAALRPLLHPASECAMHLPCAIGDYTDFYAGIHHATNVGKQFRPDNPLLVNYKHMPIGYHGRASSVRPSGVPVRRPNGQTASSDAAAPSFGPCKRLDYELELGVWVGPGNAPGEPIPIGAAAAHVAGFCLLNDWSARDIQSWEYRPLGPFLAKSFATTISCWVVTPEALAPFRIAQPARPAGDPAPLPYLLDPADLADGALDLTLEVLLSTPRQRQRALPPHLMAVSNARHLYWTVAQMVAHHSSGGCDLRPGDLLGTGTISGPDATSFGSILEATFGGKRPVVLDNGEERRFLEDGDEVLLRARAARQGVVSIGFGDCRGVVQPAPDLSGN